MRAAQFHAPHDIRISRIPTPIPTPTQVLIDIEWCGICGTDLHEYLIGPHIIPPANKPHRLTGETLPVTLGHEFCGRVSWVSDSSESGLRIGMAVMVDPRLCCRNCSQCKLSRSNVCERWGFLGLSGSGGGLSETVAVEERMCYVLPEEVDLKYAALIEPMTVARHALKSSKLKNFEELSVLVLGGGPVGLAVVLDLKAHGTKKIFVSEPSEVRRNQVGKYCDGALDPMKVDVAEECRKQTGGAGIDVVFDCAGVMPALKSGFDALRVHGTYVNAAGWEAPVCITQTILRPTDDSQLIVPMQFFLLKEISF